GADCVLLIMAALDDGEAGEMAALAGELGMDALIEVHDEAEMERAAGLGGSLIGINNRDLKTLEVDISASERLARKAPEGCFLVSESGLNTPQDLARLSEASINAFLVGESLMRQTDVEAATRALLTRTQPQAIRA
ncbi:MAG: indole-3-glycerol phosphate synthase TrpC, partial [Rhodospirillales bacterium]